MKKIVSGNKRVKKEALPSSKKWKEFASVKEYIKFRLSRHTLEGNAKYVAMTSDFEKHTIKGKNAVVALGDTKELSHVIKKTLKYPGSVQAHTISTSAGTCNPSIVSVHFA